MRLTTKFAVLVVLAVVVGACGSGDDGGAPTTSEQGQESDATTDGGTGENSGGDDSPGAGALGESALPASVPADFPIAIPAGWQIDYNEEIGLTVGSTRLFYGSEQYDEIVAFYEDWTASQPDEYQRIESDIGVTFTRSVAPPYVITIVRDHEERDGMWTLLQASGSSG